MKTVPFSPSGLGEDIFRDRYAIHENETWKQACKRVAEHIASAEDESEEWKLKFYEQLASNNFMPGGRIWHGAGREKGQMLNCFVVPSDDSREGWGDTIKDVIVISGLGGGVGVNLSNIRPRGSHIKGTGGVATGAVSLGQMIDRVGDILVGGGGRRLALMLCLDITHPDLEEFLDSKLDKDELNNANISVVININTDEFIYKVKNDKDIELIFEGKPSGKTVKAKDIWAKIVQNAWDNGEPGVLSSFNANRMNNIFYHKPLVSTNPCGEIWLEEYGCCDLGALVLPRFINSEGEFDWDELKETVQVAVRFLDNVLDVNHYPFEKIEKNCQEVRRLGLGVMGLHSMLMKLGLAYSSHQGQIFIDTLFRRIKEYAYEESIELAIEKGPFPVYDDQLLDSGFAQTLPDRLREKIKEHGLRNCALLTIAPTGTTAMVAGVSSGIEPIPAVVYWRTYFSVDERAERVRNRELVVDPVYSEYDPDVVESAADLSPRDHFEIQKICQYHVDNAVSKTINLPSDYPIDKLASLWLEYLPYIKGSTFYRWGSREFEPISPIPKSEWSQYLGEDDIEVKREEEIYDDCVTGACVV